MNILQDNLLTEIQSYHLACEGENHRGLLVLSGSEDWCIEQAMIIVAENSGSQVLWISDPVKAGQQVVPPAKAISWLGRELDIVVYNAHSGLNPDALGAISGSIVGGGLLVLLTPLLTQWPDFHDPEYRKILQYPYKAEDASPAFIVRLVSLIEQSENCLRINQEGQSNFPDMGVFQAEGERPGIDEPYRTEDQKKAVEAIFRVAKGHRRRPLVLLSDRGRGKSSSLGIAASQLLSRGVRKILVTAPRLSAVDSLFERAHTLLPKANLKQGRLSTESGEIVYVPPDELLQQHPETDLLMVDEAASIPIPILQKILHRYSRVVFASTVHGYEGTGRGFSLKFTKTLNQDSPGWKQVTMDAPIRWARNDPLERFIFQALLLNATIPTPDEICEFNQDNLVVERLDRKDLNDDKMLEKVFGMLVMAHYCTRPVDLRRILDAPDLDIFVARDERHVVGVVLCVREGGLSEDFSQAIYEGRKRLQGHLIPQSLVTHSGVINAMGVSIARVMRIAVHPSMQRQGTGSKLLEFVEDFYKRTGMDTLGVSFGATEEIVSFWKSCNFVLCRIGFRRDAASGTHSFIMLKALNDTGNILREQCIGQFIQELPLQLSEALKELDASLLCLALPDIKNQRENLSMQERHMLLAFTDANRGYEESIVSIWKLMRLALTTPSALKVLDPIDTQALFFKVLQKYSWEDTVANTGMKGKAELIERLRLALHTLLGEYEEILRTE